MDYETDKQQYTRQQLQKGRSNPGLNRTKTRGCDQQSGNGHKRSLTVPLLQPQKENSDKMPSL